MTTQWVNYDLNDYETPTVGPILAPEERYLLDGLKLLHAWIDTTEQHVHADRQDYICSNLAAILQHTQILHQIANGRALRHLHPHGFHAPDQQAFTNEA